MEIHHWDDYREFEKRKIALLEQILATLKEIQFKSTRYSTFERLPPHNQPMNLLDWEREVRKFYEGDKS